MSGGSAPAGAGQQSRSAAAGVRWWWLPVSLLAAAAAVALSLTFSGAAAPRQARDPGAFVRWALPVASTVHHFMLATVAGSLVFAIAIVPRRIPSGPGATRSGPSPTVPAHPAFTRVMTVASAASVVWAFSAVAVLILNYSNIAGQPLSSDDAFVRELVYFATDLITGQAWLAITIMAFIVSTLTFAVRSTKGLTLTAVLTFAAIIPISLIGHAAGSDDHYAGVSALALHWVGVLLWAGGVAALAAVSRMLCPSGALRPAASDGDPVPDDTASLSEPKAVLARFSALAGVAFALVLVSGIINSVLRLGGWDGLLSAYGQLILIKGTATLALGGIGLAHRQWTISGIGTGSVSATRAAWRMIIAELLIMAAVIGVAAALSRTPPPVPLETEPALTAAEIFTGYPMPAEMSWLRWVTEWRWDWLWAAVAGTAAVIYLHGVRRLHAAGLKWARARTISFMAGLLLLLYVTCSAPAVYGTVLFSVHVAALLTLTLIVPWLLVSGAPRELAVQTVAYREDGSRGLREWLDAARRDFPERFSDPVLSGAVLLVSMVLYYYGTVFGLSLELYAVDQAVNACFLMAGCWFLTTLLGAPHRPASRARRAVTAAGAAVVFFAWSIVLVASITTIEPDWFLNLGRGWGPPVPLDQQLAAVPVLVAGFAPLAVLAWMLLPGIRRRPTEDSSRTPCQRHDKHRGG